MKNKRQWFMYVLFLTVFLGIGIRFGAEAEAAGLSEEIPQAVIRECEGVSYNAIALRVDRRDDYTYEIYRSDSVNGKYQMVDTVSHYGVWTSDGDAYYTKGEKGRVTCWRYDKDYIILDQPLKFHKKYYYKIRMTDTFMDEYGRDSDIVSAMTELMNPEFGRSYSTASGGIKLGWGKIPGAQGYEIYRKTSGRPWKKVKTCKKASSVSWTDTSAGSGKVYQYRVRAYRKSGKKNVRGKFSPVCRISAKSPSVKGDYQAGSVYGPSLDASKLRDVRYVVQGFKDNYIKKGMKDFEKVLAAYNYIRRNCRYAWRGWQYNHANTAWGALIYGEAQCSGFARGMKALCDGIGVGCRYVHANSAALNPSHQWNEVKVGSKWYIIDAQGGFFLVSGKTYKNNTGMQWNTSGLPACRSDHPRGGFTGSVM